MVNGQVDYKKRALETFNLFQKYEYSDTLEARKYSDSGLIYATKSGDNELIGRAHQFKGWYYQDISKAQEANKEFYKSLAYLKKSGKKQAIADAYGNLGNSYLDMHEYQKSLSYQLLSLEENEKIIAKHPQGTALEYAEEGRTYALHNISAIYQDIGLHDKALEYSHISAQYEKENGESEGIAISYNSLATIHKSLNNTDSAIYYFNKALKVYSNFEYPSGLAGTLRGYATLENSNLSESRKKIMLEKALKLSRRSGDLDSETRTLLDIIEVQFDKLSTDSLSHLFENVYSLITENDLDLLTEIYFKLYSKYNSKIGKFDSAYWALENFIELKAISDEKKRTYELVAQDIKHQWSTKHFNDSLTIEHGFAVERAEYNEEIATIQNRVYLSVIGFIILIASFFFVVNSNRRKKRLNLILSDKNILIQEQKFIVDEKNKAISDSINYAKRLQTAILPTAALVNEFLPESFLLFKPKDVVSGDFHWFESKEDLFFIAAADCTGHGVPGAMVSVVCSNALNRAVNEFNLRLPDEILNKTRTLVIETFAKSDKNVDDGMDIALCAINRKQDKLIFSGANNPLWIIRKNELINTTDPDTILENEKVSLLEFKGNKQPIGLYENLNDFKRVEIDLMKGDTIYLFTDGFADQFGGENGKKFKYKPFKEELLKIQDKDLIAQKEYLENLFNEWKGELEQVDDVCVIGFRL